MGSKPDWLITTEAEVPFIPPEKPLQLANTMRGRPSLFRSLMAWAVLKAESGNQTCPACWIIYIYKSENQHQCLAVCKHLNTRMPAHVWCKYWVRPYLSLRVQIGWIGWDWQLHWPGFYGNHPSRYPPQSVDRGHSALTTTKYLDFIIGSGCFSFLITFLFDPHMMLVTCTTVSPVKPTGTYVHKTHY